MAENDFEKQVQQKMDELDFVPSAVVWQEVERQISGRTKRRPLFLWLSFLFLLVGGAAWIYNANIDKDNNKNKPANQKNAPPVADNQQQPANTAGRKQTQQQPSQQTDRDWTGMAKNNIPAAKYASPSGKNDSGNTAVGTKVVSRKTNAPHQHSIVHTPGAGKAANPTSNGTIAKKTGAYANNITGKTGLTQHNRKRKDRNLPAERAVAAENSVAIEPGQSKEKNDYPDQLKKENTKLTRDQLPVDSIIDGERDRAVTVAVKDSIKNTKRADSNAITMKIKTTGKSNNKIEWGISVTAGLSTISKGVTGLFEKQANNSSLTAPQNNNTGGTLNGNTTTYTQPSAVKGGFAFAAGVFISKRINKTTRLLAGLHYSYFSTRIETGTKIDSNTSAAFYRDGHSAVYTNRFHFIELPVTVEKQLGIHSRFSLSGGMAFSLLTGSNVLQHNGQNSIYYTDKSSLNSAQLGLLAGFTYRPAVKNLALDIGPLFNYSLTNIFNKALFDSRHLLFAGISIKIYFPKK